MFDSADRVSYCANTKQMTFPKLCSCTVSDFKIFILATGQRHLWCHYLYVTFWLIITTDCIELYKKRVYDGVISTKNAIVTSAAEAVKPGGKVFYKTFDLTARKVPRPTIVYKNIKRQKE